MTDVRPDWFDGFFDDDWLDEIGLRIDDERTRREVDFVVEKLELEPGARVLDVGCGHGRHSLELARRGYRVTGVDLSARSIAQARESAEREGVAADFVRLDARELGFDAEFDAAVNLFTSVIGYFDEESDDLLVLERIARSLRPGGSFLVDTLNLLGLARGFQELDWQEFDSGTLMLERRDFDFRRGRSGATWTFVRPDGARRELRHSLRVYAPHELTALLAGAGLEVTGPWGDYEGAELSWASWRLILRGDRR